MSKETFVVIDFETTGLDYKTEQVIEVAALKTDGEREIGRFQTFVSLGDRELSEFITQLTGITESDLDGGCSEEDALTALDFFIGGSTVIAQNAPFDLSFLSNYDINPKSFVCTRTLTKLLEPNENPSLKPTCQRHGIELNGHHRAMNDVEATLEIFKVMREKAESVGIQYRNTVVDSPERPLMFVPKYAKVINPEAM
jgi:DNA polymerase-3 subunit epsilon